MQRAGDELTNGLKNLASYVVLSAHAPGKPLHHHWQTCVGAGRANEGLRAGWQEQLKEVVNKCGFRYIRFHGLFHDDMFVYRKVQEEERYNWMYIDDVFDRLLDIGVRPFVELGFFPRDMVQDELAISNNANPFWWHAHIVPPANFARWTELVSRTVRHWIERYGLQEVRQWYFEVWNEPNLAAFWGGTQAQYFELYKETARTLKAIDRYLRVGGPATSNFLPRRDTVPGHDSANENFTAQTLRDDVVEWESVWIEQFLRFCEWEDLPVDFVSAHPYPTDIALDLHGERDVFSRNRNATVRDLTHIRRLVENSAYAEAEIHLTEWSSSPSSRDFMHDALPAATFVVQANIEASGLVDSLSYWTFTDIFEEEGSGNGAFHGGFGLINFQGIVKPTFHAYRFLHMLGDEEIFRACGCIATRDTKNANISILLYHYPDALTTAVPMARRWEDAQAIQRLGELKQVSFAVGDLVPGTAFVIETLDEQHGFALAEWERMGRPNSPTREQTRRLQTLAWSTQKEIVWVDERGILDITICLRPWSLVSIHVRE